jgi:AcrR family transcriptional regulator
VNSSKQNRRSQVQRRAESEGKLLSATAALIVERGLNNVSLAEIGRRAGYSHALVNHLFGTKIALIERLNKVVDDFYYENTKHAMEQSGLDGLLSFIEVYLRLVTGNDPIGRVHVVLWAEAIAGAPEIRPSRAAWDRHFREGVGALAARAAIETGRQVDVDTTAFVIVGLLRGVAMQLLVDPTSISVRAATEEVSRLVRELLGPTTTALSGNTDRG